MNGSLQGNNALKQSCGAGHQKRACQPDETSDPAVALHANRTSDFGTRTLTNACQEPLAQVSLLLGGILPGKETLCKSLCLPALHALLQHLLLQAGVLVHRKPGCQCLPESIVLPELQSPDIAVQLPALGIQSFLRGIKS